MPSTKDIIRVGDTVEIVDPKLFIRSGYPMYLPDVVKELRNKRQVADLVGSLIQEAVRGIQENEDKRGIFAYLPFWRHERLRERKMFFEEIGTTFDLSTVEYQIYRALAQRKMEYQGYGGDRRSIYLSEPIEELRGKIVRVVSKKVVKTGIRHRGYSSQYPAEEDYEAPSFTTEGTHIILGFYQREVPIEPLKEVFIPRDHVKKVNLRLSNPSC